MPSPRIALDFTLLDTLRPFAGQYRYVTDLVGGLALLAPDAEFVLLGSRPEPVPELAGCFGTAGGRWRYRQLSPASGFAAGYRDHLRYAALLRGERVHLLHALHSFVPVLAPCPIVVTIYDLMFELFAEYAQAVRSRPYRIYRWAARHRARRLIAISETTAADARRLWGIEAARIDVVPLGSPFARRLDAPQDRPPAAWGHPLLVSPFNLEPRKNLDALLVAAAQLRGRYPALRVVLFGTAATTPEREAAFERRLGELDVASAVVRTGTLSDAELHALYREADVFVFPSLYEGFGLPALEAMACGTCVVARGASAMAEIVGDAGVLVETREPAAIAEAVASLLGDDARRRQLGARARTRAASYTIERMAEQTFHSYMKALDAGVAA